MADMKAVVIGAGTISSRHIRSWNEHPNVDLTAVADISAETAQKRADEFEIPKAYADVDEMLAKEKPDLVSICTWMITHADLCEAACAAGAKGIWCEKPMAGSLEEVDRIIAAADKVGTRVTLGHHSRFQSTTIKARELIAQGAIGDPVMGLRRSGGGLFNNGTHAIDALFYMLGDPKPAWAIGHVTRDTDRYERKDPIEDSCGGIIVTEGGVRLVIESDLPEPNPPDGGPSIVGTEGTLSTGREGMKLVNAGGVQDFPAEEVDLGYAQAVELYDWVTGKIDANRCDAHINRTTIEALMGLYESARTRRVVTFPLASGPSPLHEMIADGSLPVTVPGAYDIRLKE